MKLACARPEGTIVKLHVDFERLVNEGDVIKTSTGRGYRVLEVRVQWRGKNAGRQHVTCVVLPGDWLELVGSVGGNEVLRLSPNAWVHSINWYPRSRKR